MAKQINRRDFVKGSAAAGLGFGSPGAAAPSEAPDIATSATEKLNVAFVGTAGRAGNDLR